MLELHKKKNLLIAEASFQFAFIYLNHRWQKLRVQDIDAELAMGSEAVGLYAIIKQEEVIEWQALKRK